MVVVTTRYIFLDALKFTLPKKTRPFTTDGKYTFETQKKLLRKARQSSFGQLYKYSNTYNSNINSAENRCAEESRGSSSIKPFLSCAISLVYLNEKLRFYGGSNP